VIDVRVSLGEYDDLFLVVGDAEEVNFEVRATLADGSGDYRVTAAFDTGAGGSGAAWLTAKDGQDSLSVAEVTNPYGVETLDPASYDLTLYESSAMETGIDSSAVNVDTPE